MANTPKGGKRLAGSNPAPDFKTSNSDSNQSFNAQQSQSTSRVEDAVIDEILRSLAGIDFNTTAAPNRTLNEGPRRNGLQPPRSRYARRPDEAPEGESPSAAASDAAQQTSAFRASGQSDGGKDHSASAQHAGAAKTAAAGTENEYQAAAAHFVNKQMQDREENAAAQRDPSQTQVFQPARPARRDTDRMPTLVDDEPRKQHPVLNRLATFVVVLLILVALVLGTKMVYILGPSLGWDLPDLSNVPVVSTFLGLIPDAEEKPMEMPESTSQGVEQVGEETPVPTSVTLDAENLTLKPGDTKVLTATLDVENWQGLLAWASSDRESKIIKLSVLGPNTAQVEYVSEGKCAVAVQVGIKTTDGTKAPSATCYIECVAGDGDSQEAGGEQEAETQDQPAETEENTSEHIDIVLNREDFTLKAGERHQLMQENADQVTWTSSDEEVATVENGIVTAVASGRATITATGPDGTTASAICRVR